MFPSFIRNLQSNSLQSLAYRCEDVLGLLTTLQWGPEAEPIRSPENNLHNEVSFEFVKYNIIPASPDGPTHSSHPNQDHTSKPLILIMKPSAKHMADRSWLS